MDSYRFNWSTISDQLDRLFIIKILLSINYYLFGYEFIISMNQSSLCFFYNRYMFFFQLPWLPEMFLGANDLMFLDACFRGSESGLGDIGLKNKKMMSADDVSVFKHAIHSFRK